MKNPATLIDRLYRATFRNDKHFGWTSPSEIRKDFTAARRFVLDDDMSAFLAELSAAAFSSKAPLRAIDSMRVSSRLPHATTWIEYNLRKEREQFEKIFNRPRLNPKEVPLREGWLFKQHPVFEQVITAHIFNSVDPPESDSWGFDTWMFPVGYMWTTDATLLPFAPDEDKRFIGQISELITGVNGYKSESVGIITSDYSDTRVALKRVEAVRDLITEWAGVVRRMWALLSSINDIPVLRKETTQTKGFVARGSYRKFLTHTTIVLHVPQAVDLRKVARKAIADARRRAHQVRGHWRLDYRHPGRKQCAHFWGPEQVCSACGAHRYWITEHQRGDASIGFVTHDYAVRHDLPKPLKMHD